MREEGEGYFDEFQEDSFINGGDDDDDKEGSYD